MKPAFSVISFTTVAGAGQGLAVALVFATLSGVPLGPTFLPLCLAVALVLLGAGLVASFFHLGHPERAWRAMAMWRTSWLSREVILLPLFMAIVFVWMVLAWRSPGHSASGALAFLALVLAAALWVCTAQIYACLRFIQEWAHPLTLVNFTLIGLSSGMVLACALAALRGETALLAAALPWALTLTFAAWACRTASLMRNAGLKPKSSAQSATGIPAARLVQKSMGMSAGAFNTREFFHGATDAFVRHVRWAVHGLAFALPALLMMAARDASGAQAPWLCAAVAAQVAGVLAERWLFFAQARHPQNLYYQAVS
jgi:DMSO reductase anchor subunit